MASIAFNPYSFGIMAGANTLNAITSGMMNKTAYNMQADAYDTQAMMALYSNVINQRYLNMELGSQIDNIYDTGRQIQGTQVAAHAASGFTDISTGDKRLLSDTERKTEKEAYIANTNAYLKSFEMEREANLQNIYYKAQAKIARQQAKYAGGWGMFSNILTGLLSSAAGSMSPANNGVTDANVGLK